MNERILANGGLSLYPISRGKNMGEVGEKAPGKVQPPKPDVPQVREDILQHLQELQGILGQGQESGEPQKRSLSSMGDFLDLMQEAVEVNSPKQIFETEVEVGGKGLKNKVWVYRNDDGKVYMSRLPGNKYDAKTVGEILGGAGIKFVKPQDWDTLTPDEKITFLEGVGIETLGSDVVDLGPETWGEVLPQNAPLTQTVEFKQLLNWKYGLINNPQLVAPNLPTLQELNLEIDRRISGNAGLAYLMAASVDWGEFKRQMNPAQLAQFNLIFTQAEENTLNLNKQNFDQHFEGPQGILTQMNSVQKRAAIGDIDALAGTEVIAVRQGWHSVDQSIVQILQKAAQGTDLPFNRGLRMWYAFKQIEKVQGAYEVYEKFQVKADVVQNMRTAEAVMRFFEQTKDSENFNFARQRLLELLQAVTLSTDQRVSAAQKDILRKRMESFTLVNTLLITSEKTEGGPADLHKIALNFSNETVRFFYDRFNNDDLLDENEKPYLVDANGVEIELNVVGVAENVILRQYLIDRFKVNRVQEMTQRNLNFDNIGEDEEWIVKRLIKNNDVLAPQIIANWANLNDVQRNTAIANLNLAALTQAQRAEVNRIWNLPKIFGRDKRLDFEGNKKMAIEEWYKETTFMGADGYDPRTGRLRTEEWRDKIIQTELRNRLLVAGVDPERVNALLGTLRNPNLPYDAITNPIGILQNPNLPFNPVNNPVVGGLGDYELTSAINRNGYDLAKWKYADTLDRLRLYNGGVHTESVFGEDTPYQARLVTYFMDFALNEYQGDEDVNRIVRGVLDERHSSYLLPQNITAPRLLSGVLPSNISEQIYDMTTQFAGNRGVPRLEVEGEVFTNILMEGLDPNNPDPLVEALTQVDWGEASKKLKSYPIHDMYDDRQKAMAWMMGEFRTWLKKPLPEQFMAMMDKYYSTRNPRVHPGAEDLLIIEWFAGHIWKEKFGYEENITNAQMDGFVKRAEELNLIDKIRGERVRSILIGGKFERQARQISDTLYESFKKTGGSPGWWMGSFIELLKAMFAYAAKQ